MARYNPNPSDPQTAFFRRSNAADLQSEAAAYIAGLGVGRIISAITLSGGGAGSLFTLTVEHTVAADGVGLSSAQVASSLRVYSASTAPAVALAYSAALADAMAANPGVPLRDAELAGSAAAAVSFGLLVLARQLNADVVEVSSLADLPAPVAGVISLVPGTCYQIRGMVDVGPNTLRLAQGTVLHGSCHQVLDGLIRSAGAGPLLDNIAGASFAVTLLTLTHLAGGNPYYFADVGGPLATTQALVADCNLLFNSAPGVVDGVSQATLARIGIQACSGVGFENRGAITQLVYADMLASNNVAPLTLVRAAPGATAGVFALERLGDNRLNAGSVSMDLDGLPASTTVFVSGCVFIGPGASATALTAARRAEPTWNYESNYGLVPSIIAAENKFSLSVAGGLSPAAVPAGTWQNIPASYVCALSPTTQRFIQAAGSPDQLQYVGVTPAETRFIPIITIEAAAGTQRMGLTINVNGVDIAGAETSSEVTTTATLITTVHQVLLNPLDLVRMRIRNIGSTTQWRLYSANLTAIGLY